MMNAVRQEGATLIELLISVAIGLIITASMLGMYVTSTANSSQVLKSSKLNQELTTLMTVMTNDIRRAGASGENYSDPSENEFSTLLVLNDGKCIIYSYDANLNGAKTTAVSGRYDLYGFLLEGDVVYILHNYGKETYDKSDCSTADADAKWEELTNNNTFSIANLYFDLTTDCVNVDYDVDPDAGCPGNADPPDTGDYYLLFTDRVEIMLQGSLKSDPTAKLSIGRELDSSGNPTGSDPVYVRIRNNRVEVKTI